MNGYNIGLQIDRIDNDGNYTPENCRWVDRITNANNTSTTIYIDYNGEKTPLMNLLRLFNKVEMQSVVRNRILRGWDPITAIQTLEK